MGFLDDVFRDVDRLVRMGATPLALAMSPGAMVVASYRLGRAIRTLPRQIRFPLVAAHAPLDLALRTMTSTDIPAGADIGGGLHVGHIGGIVVSPQAHIGRDCNLSQGVTIGVGGRGDKRGVPFIGDRVYIGPGAKVFGPIRIGNDVAIGANAVVCDDVPDNAVVVGMPARIISMRGSADFVVKGRRRPPLGKMLAEALTRKLPLPAAASALQLLLTA